MLFPEKTFCGSRQDDFQNSAPGRSRIASSRAAAGKIIFSDTPPFEYRVTGNRAIKQSMKKLVLEGSLGTSTR